MTARKSYEIAWDEGFAAGCSQTPADYEALQELVNVVIDYANCEVSFDAIDAWLSKYVDETGNFIPDSDPIECDCDSPSPDAIGECSQCRRRVMPDRR